jgi:hypothetical protein
MEGSERRLTTDDLASGREDTPSETVEEPRRVDDDAAAREGQPAEPARPDVGGTESAASTAMPAAAGATDADADASGSEPLLGRDEAGEYQSRWESIQTGFVDEPRRAVEQADALVADAMQRLAETFSEERKNLEGQWDRGDDVSTEDLRVALQRYRSFFDRLLSA